MQQRRPRGRAGWSGLTAALCWLSAVGPAHGAPRVAAALDVVVDPQNVNVYRPSEIVPRSAGRGGEHRNFVDCVKSRKPCYAPAETGHRTITIAHIGNIAMLLGRKLKWNPEKERFVDDAEADKMLSRTQREPWTIANIDSWIKENA